MGREIVYSPLYPLKLACDKLAAGIPLNREEYDMIKEALAVEYGLRFHEWKREIDSEWDPSAIA